MFMYNLYSFSAVSSSYYSVLYYSSLAQWHVYDGGVSASWKVPPLPSPSTNLLAPFAASSRTCDRAWHDLRRAENNAAVAII